MANAGEDEKRLLRACETSSRPSGYAGSGCPGFHCPRRFAATQDTRHCDFICSGGRCGVAGVGEGRTGAGGRACEDSASGRGLGVRAAPGALSARISPF